MPINELRKKIKGIKSTRQITNAMKKVAVARFARAQREAHDSSRFPNELEKTLKVLVRASDPSKKSARFVTKPAAETTPRIGLVIITGDKGLCGDFNTSLLREVSKFLKTQGNTVARIFAIGRKACDYSRRIGFEKRSEHTNVFLRLSFADARRIGGEIVKSFTDDNLTGILIMSTMFISSMKRKITQASLLPLVPDASEKVVNDMPFEPAETEDMFENLVPLWFNARLYNTMRLSYAAELAARMAAMDNATRNAGTLIDRITLAMNKERQSIITREIAEITGTSEVMKE